MVEPGDGPLLASCPLTEAKNNCLSVPIEDGARRRLKLAAEAVGGEEVLVVAAKNLDVVHVPEPPLAHRGHHNAGQLLVQLPQKRLNI